MAKYKKFLLIVFIIALSAVPAVVIHYDHTQSRKAYNECMSWDSATKEECIAYLD